MVRKINTHQWCWPCKFEVWIQECSQWLEHSSCGVIMIQLMCHEVWWWKRSCLWKVNDRCLKRIIAINLILIRPVLITGMYVYWYFFLQVNLFLTFIHSRVIPYLSSSLCFSFFYDYINLQLLKASWPMVNE